MGGRPKRKNFTCKALRRKRKRNIHDMEPDNNFMDMTPSTQATTSKGDTDDEGSGSKSEREQRNLNWGDGLRRIASYLKHGIQEGQTAADIRNCSDTSRRPQRCQKLGGCSPHGWAVLLLDRSHLTEHQHQTRTLTLTQ